MKNTGNDSNTGLSDSQAWKTISKVNTSTFHPGDSILFKRGDIWREGIIVSDNGKTDSYITYAAYGTGNDPIINGSDIMKGWAEYSTNVWKTSCAAFTNYLGLEFDYVVIVDGVMFTQVATLAEVITAKTYFIDKTPDPDNVYIYSTSDPDSKTAEVSARMFGLYVNNKTYVKLSGLEFRNAGHSGVYFFGSVNGQVTGYSIIDDCNFYRNRINGIQFYDGYSNNIVQNCASTYNGNGYYSASYTSWGADDNIFRKCYAGYSIRYRVGTWTDGHGFGVYNSDDCIVENSEAEHCFYGIIIDPNNKANDFICRYNYVHDTEPDEAGIRVGGDIPVGTIHEVCYNLIVNAGGGTRYPYAIAVGGPSRVGYVHLYNNTIYQDATSEHSGFGIFASIGTNLTIKNNIVYSNANYKNLLIIGPGSGFVSDNNCFFAPNVTANLFTYNGINYHSLSAWKSATGQDIHSLYGDPLFINNSSDWDLQANSPAVNKGANVGLTKDNSGNPIVGLPDIGAFETQSGTSTTIPVYAGSTIENATPSRLEMTYNLTLANIVPVASSFSVHVNSNARGVSSVNISGAKVLLTLASPVAYGNVVTVAYTKPSTNPLQTTAGGQAASITAQTVTNRVAALAVPAFSGASIENTAPSRLEISYNLTLANTVPATSAFTVIVNSTARNLSSVTISGTKVLLTLVSPIAYGNVVSVAYTKPSTNPLQTTAGGQAASITAQTVTNRVAAPAVPVFSGASIENTTPSILEISYNLALANVIPATSAFAVSVNSIARTVSTVAVSGTKVLLTLASPVAYGDVVTVAYTKPSANPVQTPAGGQAENISSKLVTNNVDVINIAPVVVVKSPQSCYSGFVNEINASGSYDANKDNLTFTWSAPVSVPLSSTSGATIKFLGPIVSEPTTVELIVRVSDGKTTQSKVVPVEILPYKPELEAAEVLSVEASSYYTHNYPQNIIDGNIGTMWSAGGIDQWLMVELKDPFNIQHVKLAFQPGQKRESYFDVLGSDDKKSWEPILTKSISCGFSADPQVFDFPLSKAVKEFRYVKLIGLGNSTDTWNYISELKIYGFRHPNLSFYENLAVKLYPNPASSMINIRIDEPTLSADFIRIINFLGKVVFQNNLDPEIREFQIPINLQNGFYIVQMGSGNMTLFTQKLIVNI